MREIDQIMSAAMTNMAHQPSRQEIEDDLLFLLNLLNRPDALAKDGRTGEMVERQILTRKAQLLAFSASQN